MPEKTFTQKEYDAYGLDQYLRGVEDGLAAAEDRIKAAREDGFKAGKYQAGKELDYMVDSGEWDD